MDSNFQLRCDFGSGDHLLHLPVNVSNGVYHVANVTRYGNQVILKLDDGQGDNYAELLPDRADMQLIRVDEYHAFAGANVTYLEYNQALTGIMEESK